MKPLPPEKIAKIREDFDFFDRDGNGRIDLEEFEKLLAILSPQSTKQQAEKGFSLIDGNHDSEVDFDEFLAWWQTCWWEF